MDPEDPNDLPCLDPFSGEVESVEHPTMIPIDTTELVDTHELIGRSYIPNGWTYRRYYPPSTYL